MSKIKSLRLQHCIVCMLISLFVFATCLMVNLSQVTQKRPEEIMCSPMSICAHAVCDKPAKLLFGVMFETLVHMLFLSVILHLYIPSYTDYTFTTQR